LSAEHFLVGKVISVAGTDGVVKVTPYSDYTERFQKSSEVFLDFWGDKKKFFIEKTEFRNKVLYIKFKNFEDSRDVELLVGREIFVPSDKAVRLPENNFFIHDLIGSEVILRNVLVGTIADVLDAPANNVLVVKSIDVKEILLPFILDYIEKFDTESKKLLLKSDVSLEDDED
jgi:16S rRNA processing protein RimM